MKKLKKGVVARTRDFVRDWSLPRQLAGKPLFTDASRSHASDTLRPRLEEADRVGTSVGCGQLIYAKNGKPIHIEGDPRSPVNQGTLCPKGAGTLGMLLSPARISNALYRAPYSDTWEPKPLDWCMERIAQLTKQTRDDTFAEALPDGRAINHTLGVSSLGGATMDNEENYLIKKLFTGGLGTVSVENQARI